MCTLFMKHWKYFYNFCSLLNHISQINRYRIYLSSILDHFLSQILLLEKCCAPFLPHVREIHFSLKFPPWIFSQFYHDPVKFTEILRFFFFCIDPLRNSRYSLEFWHTLVKFYSSLEFTLTSHRGFMCI